jgi:hypothetical protein
MQMPEALELQLQMTYNIRLVIRSALCTRTLSKPAPALTMDVLGLQVLKGGNDEALGQFRRRPTVQGTKPWQGNAGLVPIQVLS